MAVWDEKIPGGSTNRWPTWATMGQAPDMKPAADGGGASTWGPIAVSTGLGILGGVLNSRAHNQPEQWRQKIVESEIGRRNALQGFAAPTLSGMLGYRTAGPGQTLQGQLGGGAPGSGGGSGAGGYTAGTQSSRLGKAGEIAGGIVGTALGGPLGGMAGSTAGKVYGMIGRGRRTANGFVQGTENAFGGDLATISTMAKTDPAGAASLFKQKYANYQAMLNAEMAAGGNRAKVAQQSASNPQLQQTIRALAQQLGVAI